MFQKAIEIANYLSKYQTKEGLIDPLTKKSIKNSYGNSFYALLCAKIYKKSKEKIWLKRATHSLNIELDYIKQRKKIKGIFRWEFKNYALINCYEILEFDLNNLMKKKLEEAILSWANLCSFQTNWVAMRSLNHFLRYNSFKRKKDLLKSKFELNLLLKRQTKKGFFPDDIQSNSFQYHVYILALLYQLYKKTKNYRIKKSFLKGINFIVQYINPDGNFCYYGRGQEQIFGYASLIYSLAGAFKLTKNQKYNELAKSVYMYSIKFKDYNIVLNNDEKNNAGWYGYNNKIDYLSFYAVYLIYSSEILSGQKINKTKSNSFMCISIGGRNSSEMGGISNIYPTIIPCQGGPPFSISLNQVDYSLNYFGPLYKFKNPLMCKSAKIINKKDFLIMQYKLKDFDLIYTFCKFGSLHFRVNIKPKKRISIVPLHISCFKKPITSLHIKKKGDISTPDGKAQIYESSKIVIKKELEYTVNFDNLKTNMIIKIFDIKPTLFSIFIYKSQKIIYFGIVLLYKLISKPKDFFLLLKYYKIVRKPNKR